MKPMPEQQSAVVHRTALSLQVTEQLKLMGFPAAFAQLVGEQMNTDFTARQMLGYLRDARPRTKEAVADEMLGILEMRDRIVERKLGAW